MSCEKADFGLGDVGDGGTLNQYNMGQRARVTFSGNIMKLDVDLLSFRCFEGIYVEILSGKNTVVNQVHLVFFNRSHFLKVREHSIKYF